MVLRYVHLILLIVYANSSPFDLLPEELSRSAIVPRNDDPHRLPENTIEVTLYDIELRLQNDMFDSNEFGGITFVLFKTLIATNEIKIHANKLDFVNVAMAAQDGNLINLTNPEFVSDPETDILVLTTATELPANTSYQIRFTYTAQLRTNEMYGFYRSAYIRPDGTERYLGTTQLQPTHARKVFPCFDEPLYKAVFDIKIRHPRLYQAIGNTRGSRSVDVADLNYVVTTFATTPRMPTYLIAFVVSDFTCSESVPIEAGIQHWICSRDEAESTRKLALEFGPKLTWAMEEFTGVKFSVSQIGKIHQFAIPDFAAGAMENWGLITYRETALLWDENESSNRYKQRVITVVAHELAHFWFGDLVTTHWWSDTFLNEGWATYFEYHIAHQVDPLLELDKQFVIETLQSALVSDASPSSTALSSAASTPGEIMGRFGTISYNKGGSIFRMVEHFMGTANFKAAINKYLTDNQFKNTNPDMLWQAFQSYAPEFLPTGTMMGVMADWVTRPGYPVLKITSQDLSVTVRQNRYLSSGEPAFEDKWNVPVSYTTSSDSNKFQDTSPKFWLTASGLTTLLSVLKNESDWIIFNNQQTGYYRVDYDNPLWEKIKLALNKPGFDGIHELNRAQIVDDFFNFARYGYRSFSELLDLYQFLKKETSYYTWYPVFNAFSYMIQRTSSEPLRRSLSAYILDLAEVFYNSVPFNEAKDNNQIYTHKKVLVMPWACNLGLQDCIDNSVAAFAAYRTTNKKPDKNLRSVIYCNGLRHSTEIQSDWDFLWNEFLDTKLATEQVTILTALGCATDVTVLRNYLSKSIDPSSGIRQQDALSVFSAVYSGNPAGVDVALDFLIQNYPAISEYYASMNSLLNLFNGLVGRFTKKEQTDKLSQFIERTDLGDANLAAVAALNAAVRNLDWIEEFEQELTLYFTPKEEEEEGGGETGSSASLTIGLTTILTTLFTLCYQSLY